MRLLKDILYKAGAVELHGSTNTAIMSLTADSRKVEKNGLFVAVKGTLSDGHSFIQTALEKGAISIVCEQLPQITEEKICYVVVKDSAFALGVRCPFNRSTIVDFVPELDNENLLHQSLSSSSFKL